MIYPVKRSSESENPKPLESSGERSRFILQNLINLVHDLIRKLGHYIQRLDSLMDLLNFRGTCDRTRNIRVLKDPSHGEAGLVRTKLFRNGLRGMSAS